MVLVTLADAGTPIQSSAQPVTAFGGAARQILAVGVSRHSRESGNPSQPISSYKSFFEVPRDAGVQGAIGFICKDVNVENFR